jgi:phosphate starvation-inducible PhoH-like protein
MEKELTFVVEQSELLSKICGTNDDNLKLIEAALNLTVYVRGNEVSVTFSEKTAESEKEKTDKVLYIFKKMLDEAKQSEHVCSDFVNSILIQTDGKQNCSEKEKSLKENVIQIPGGKKSVYPKSLNQASYIQSMKNYDMVFATGPAGSGKTFLAVAQALSFLFSKKCKKLVLTRPVVEAGENLGFLPGEIEQKLHPYLRPLYDAMESLLPFETLRKLSESGIIEIAPLAYMRGRTLSDCIVSLDEAQNTTCEQMKMFLTRLGEGSRAFITGDVTQTDLRRNVTSGLIEALDILKDIDEIAIHRLKGSDVVRNPLVKKIIQAYENAER